MKNSYMQSKEAGWEMASRACRSLHTMVMPRDENELFGIAEYFDLPPNEVTKRVGPLGVDVRELEQLSRQRAA